MMCTRLHVRTSSFSKFSIDQKSVQHILRSAVHLNVIALSKAFALHIDKSAIETIRWAEGVAKEMKGQGNIVYINCG